ncbi:MAG: hypothetical protein RLZ55_1052, partial [Actinomycetota bacterium]
TPPPGPTGSKVIGYYSSWATYGRNYQVADIPADKLTHINYAFANVSNGQCVLGDAYADTDKFFPGDSWDAGAKRGNFNQLAKLKAAHPNVKTLISVGGWTWSANFSAAAASDASRAAFADSCVKFMKSYGFDGIDIDWEYPVSGGLQAGKPEDKRNYTLLLQALDAALKKSEAADSRDYLLTIAAPAGPGNVNNLEVPGIAASTDWINLMTYDYNGAWNKYTGHNAPLVRSASDVGPAGFDVTSTVKDYLAKGAPASKLVLGVPFYGRSWAGVPSTNSGLGQNSTGAGPGTWEPGIVDYHDLAANYLTRLPVQRDAVSKVPYLYDPAAKVFVSYDDPTSLTEKASLIKSQGLGGAMVWELSSDSRSYTLMNALTTGMK